MRQILLLICLILLFACQNNQDSMNDKELLESSHDYNDLEEGSNLEKYDYPPMIFMNDQLYIISPESSEIHEDDIECEIGAITMLTSNKPSHNGEANIYTLESKIYKKINTDVKDSIIIMPNGPSSKEENYIKESQYQEFISVDNYWQYKE